MMFDNKHYVPILKAKQGEFRALQETSSHTKEMMTPLLEVINVAWDYETEAEAKTIEQHLEGLGQKILDSCGAEKRVFVDSNLIDGDRKMADGLTHHLDYLFNDFTAKNLNTVPVTSLSKHPDYKTAVQKINAVANQGICLRLQNSDLSIPALQASIDADLTLYSLTPAEVDLVVDLGGIETNSLGLLGLTIPTLINSAIPYINDWRSFTLSATAFPVNLSGISGNTIAVIDRVEWTFWASLASVALTRQPSFSDYGIAHPEIADIDPRILTMSASIRYTADNNWIVIKGKSTKKHGFEQFYTLCEQLIALPEYSGAGFSWGDKYINDCAVRDVKTGNATTWRIVGNNHHFEKVVTQISSLV